MIKLLIYWGMAMFINKYELTLKNLIDTFIAKEISAAEFEGKYLPAWRDYRDSMVHKQADIETRRYFDSIFTALDDYCSDPDLLDEDDLDDDDLFNAALKLKAEWEESQAHPV